MRPPYDCLYPSWYELSEEARSRLWLRYGYSRNSLRQDGCSEIVGYDIDERSVNNAQHNAQLNGVDNMEVLFGNASVINHISGMFDLVMANINRNILLADMKSFRSVLNEGGYLILSGFYNEDIPVLMEKAEELGLREVSRRDDEGWACLILTTP